MTRLLVLLCFFTLTGCNSALVAPRYSALGNNVLALRSLASAHPHARLKVGAFEGPFTSADGTQPPTNIITCRLGADIQPPDQLTFAGYLASGLSEELKMAGLYDSESGVPLTGILKQIDFSSVSGYWTIKADVRIGTGVPFEVDLKREYETSFVGVDACRTTVEALLPTVQDFTGKVFAAPEFKEALSSKGMAPDPKVESKAVPET